LLGLTFALAAAGIVAEGGEKTEGDEEALYRQAMIDGAQALASGSKEGQAMALNLFKSARKYRPDSADAHYWIGLTYSDYQNYAEAAAFAEQATLLDSRHAEAWHLWGQSLMYLMQWEEARQKLEQAHRLDPNNPLIIFNRGRCLFHGFNRQSEALELFKEVLRYEPANPSPAYVQVFNQARLYIGCCYQGRDMPAAIIHYAEVLKRDPRNIEARYRLAVAYRKDGRFDRAEKELQAVLADSPWHAESLLQMGQLYAADLPDVELARAYLEKFIKVAHDDHPWLPAARTWLQEHRDETKARSGKKEDLTSDAVKGAVRRPAAAKEKEMPAR
ncbi:MAG: tetratricopeptide repeat protein, partial [Planctomycetota bacterium]|nr:tetratricopeptide repeat protein [Planctomycetota bacterium]